MADDGPYGVELLGAGVGEPGADVVAEPEMNARPARPNSGPTASTSWLPAGPTTPTRAGTSGSPAWASMALRSSVKWSNTKTFIGFATFADPKDFSSGSPRKSAER